MSERIPNRALPAALPPTVFISDPQMRAWADAMSSAWSLRNGGGGPEEEQFIRRADVGGFAESAIVRVLGQAFGGETPPANGGGIASVQRVIDEVLGSKVVEYLRTPIQQIAAPMQKLEGLIDRVKNNLNTEVGLRVASDVTINSRIDALVATSGDAEALIAEESEARAAGDAANASLSTLIQAALYADMEAGPNKVVNPGFRPDGGGGWNPAQILAWNVPGVPSGAPSEYVLRKSERDTQPQPRIRATPGEVFDVSVWAACAGASTVGTGIWFGLVDASTGAVSYTPVAVAAPGLTGWTQVKGSLTIPSGYNAFYLDLQIDQAPSGGSNFIYFAQPFIGRRSGVGAIAMASIVSEREASVTRDTALASDISGLSTRIGSSEASILSELTTRSNKDNSLAQAINTIWAAVGSSSALIQDSSLAAVSPAAVAASKWLQVQAAVTDPNTGLVNAVSIKQELNAYASAANNSFNATYGVRLNVNGVISGFSLMATSGAGSAPGAVSSTFAILADRLALVSPTNASVLPFTVDSSGNAIFAGYIYAAGGIFSGTVSVGSSPARSGGTMTGSGAVFNSDGTFAIGNAGGNITYDGGTIRLNGAVVSSGSFQVGAVNNAAMGAGAVDTGNIVVGAGSAAYASSSGGASAAVTVSIPSGAASISVMAFFGSNAYQLLYTAADTGEGGGAPYLITISEAANGSISSPFGSNTGTGAAAFTVANPSAGTYTFTATRATRDPGTGHAPSLGGNITIIAILTKR